MSVTVPVSVFVTTTFLAPTVPAGVVAVIDVGLTTVTLVAAAPPMVTVAPVANWVPVMVIDVPPTSVPLLGLMLVIVGAKVLDAPKVYWSADEVAVLLKPTMNTTVSTVPADSAGVVATTWVPESLTIVPACVPK